LELQGTLSATLDDVTLSANGSSVLSGSLAATLDAVTLSSAGTLAISGAASVTLDDATITSTGALAIQGSLASILDDISLSSNGSSIAGINANLAVTLDDCQVDSTGNLELPSIIASTEWIVPGFVKGPKKRKGQVFGEEFPYSPDIGSVQVPIDILKTSSSKSTVAIHDYSHAIIALMHEML
jgi:hypothetical protein